jgi:hypothetical protein
MQRGDSVLTLTGQQIGVDAFAVGFNGLVLLPVASHYAVHGACNRCARELRERAPEALKV